MPCKQPWLKQIKAVYRCIGPAYKKPIYWTVVHIGHTDVIRAKAKTPGLVIEVGSEFDMGWNDIEYEKIENVAEALK